MCKGWHERGWSEIMMDMFNIDLVLPGFSDDSLYCVCFWELFLLLHCSDNHEIFFLNMTEVTFLDTFCYFWPDITSNEHLPDFNLE